MNMSPLFEKLKNGLKCDSAGMPESVIGRTVCVVAHPGKMILFPFFHWFEEHYKGRYKFARAVFTADLFLLGVALLLGVIALFLFLFQPADITEKIHYDVSVAPREIVSGAPSTLVIHYTNGTKEELRNVTMSMAYPAHFSLQEILFDDTAIHGELIDIGTIPIGGTGSIKIKGVMFGDVGGEQTFRSLMTFTYGEEDALAQKIAHHTFSPVSSTLALELLLPEKVIAEQPISGTIRYSNTGEINFPEITIEPEWPETFTFTSADIYTPYSDLTFRLPSINAGTYGEMIFSGYLGAAQDEVTFIFHPSFTFEDTTYRQKTLVHTSPVIPPPLTAEISLEKEALRPGSTTEVTIGYQNNGTVPIEQISIGFTSKSPFFSNKTHETNGADILAPGETATVTINAPLRSTIYQSEVDVYENLVADMQVFATYTLAEETPQEISYTGPTLTVPITTPVILESYARYTMPSGDQIGRGMLPPRTGMTTKYWIFWHVAGTTSTINNATITGSLGPNVSFTGRQSVAQGSAISYNTSTSTISWNTDALSPTLSPSSQIIGVAFEVALTPNETQIGTTPILMHDIQITGTDAITGAFVSTYGANINTNLPNDALAAGYAEVR
jgi:hypothetical protein